LVNTRHALIVEDEGLLLDSLEESLRRVAWLRITKARTAEIALEQMESDPPDVVLTDVRMPGMGGLELLDQLRIRSPHVPVVVMTAYGVHLQREAMRRGATCFLEKPFRMSELRGVLQLLLAKIGDHYPEPHEHVSFEGRLESLSLPDIVQVLCLSRQDVRVEVSLAERAGSLWLRDGAVVDGQFEEVSGAEAFYKLAEHGVGRFRVLPDALPRPRTVNENWQELLMEAARRYDEGAQRGRSPGARPSWRPSLLVPLVGSGRPPSFAALMMPSGFSELPTQSLADMLGDFPAEAEVQEETTPVSRRPTRPPELEPSSAGATRSVASDTEPDAPDAAVRAGAAAMERGELEAARRIFERAIARWPDERLLRANLSRLSRLAASKVSPAP